MQSKALQTVEANGVELCVESFGDRRDPPILLIHGAGSCMLHWDDELCELLAAGARHVVRYDLRDAGRSVTYAPGTADYSLRDLVGDCAGLIDALGLRPAHLVGLSLGGGIAQLMALDQPEHVASITLASATPGGPGHENPDLPPPADGLFDNEPAAPDWHDREAVIEYLVEAERPFGARSRRFEEERMRALAGRVYDHSNSIESTFTNSFRLDVGEPWRQRLGAISVPTLVIHGTEDPCFPHEHAVATAEAIPGATLLSLERTGHEYFPRATWDIVLPAILRHTYPDAA